MIQDRIAKIETTLANADLAPTTREELLALLAELKTEVSGMEAAHGEKAQSITRSADAAFSLASSPEETTPAVLEELRESVVGFEASHPRLVQVVDRIALTLSNMGI
jgi:F0F1-type ATP synthase membrane subunit b/b'